MALEDDNAAELWKSKESSLNTAKLFQSPLSGAYLKQNKRTLKQWESQCSEF